MFFVLTKNESPEPRAKRAFLEGERAGKKRGLRSGFLDDLSLTKTKDPGLEGDRVRYWDIVVAESSKIRLRKQMVAVALGDGVSEAARRFGASRHTVRKWRDWYEAEGVRGLADRSLRRWGGSIRVGVLCRFFLGRRRARATWRPSMV